MASESDFFDKMQELAEKVQELRSLGREDKRIGKTAGELAGMARRLKESDLLSKLGDDLAEIETLATGIEQGETQCLDDLSRDHAGLDSWTDDSFEIDDFFTQISKAVVDAQKDLDQRSLRYARDLRKSDPSLPPSHFTIPQVKTEMKVGFRKSSSSGLQLVLFSSRKKKEEYAESTLSFEVAAAPAPPRLHAEMDEAPPGSPSAPGPEAGTQEGADVEAALDVDPQPALDARSEDPAGPAPVIPAFLVEGDDRDRVLALDKKIKRSRSTYAPKEDALVLRCLPRQPPRYLVIWRAKRANGKDHVTIADLVESGGDFQARTRLVSIDQGRNAFPALVTIVETIARWRQDVASGQD